MIQMTQDRLDKKLAKLKYLKEVRRPEVAEHLKEARAFGDISENAEYDAAKDEQRDLEARIHDIEQILKNVEVIDEENFDSETINFGCSVHFEDMESKQEYVYKLSGSTEADILGGSISNESPIGAKLMGAKVGQVITVDAPNGKYNYKILDFKRD